MATLTITKSYEDGTLLFESDLDNFRAALLTLFNTTKLNNSNIAAGGLLASNFFVDVVDDDTLANQSNQFTIKDAGIDLAKIGGSTPALALYGSLASIRMHHTYNGAAPIPRGWLACTGQVINETNYDALHGSGAYAADGIASSALLNKYTPNLVGAYASGTSSGLTEDGDSSISTTGSNTSGGVAHGHRIIDIVSGGHDHYYNASGTETDLPANTASTAESLSVNEAADFTHTQDIYAETNTVYSSTASSSTINIEPTYYEVIYIMRVV